MMLSTQLFVAWLAARVRSERGAALVEYAFLLVLVVLVCLGAVMYFGSATSASTTNTANSVIAAN